MVPEKMRVSVISKSNKVAVTNANATRARRLFPSGLMSNMPFAWGPLSPSRRRASIKEALRAERGLELQRPERKVMCGKLQVRPTIRRIARAWGRLGSCGGTALLRPKADRDPMPRARSRAPLAACIAPWLVLVGCSRSSSEDWGDPESVRDAAIDAADDSWSAPEDVRAADAVVERAHVDVADGMMQEAGDTASDAGPSDADAAYESSTDAHRGAPGELDQSFGDHGHVIVASEHAVVI